MNSSFCWYSGKWKYCCNHVLWKIDLNTAKNQSNRYFVYLRFLRTRMQLFQDTINLEEEIAITANENSLKSKSQFQWFFIVTVNRSRKWLKQMIVSKTQNITSVFLSVTKHSLILVETNKVRFCFFETICFKHSIFCRWQFQKSGTNMKCF
jgi:hypothetical protein